MRPEKALLAVNCIALVPAISRGGRMVTFTGVMLVLTLVIQFGLGLANIIYLLPLGVATAHNGVASLLLLEAATLLFLTRKS